MKSYRSIILIITAIGMLAFSDSTRAGGFGFYVQAGGGNAEWEADDLRGDFDFETDAGHAGLGVVYDSNVSRNTLFNYRASLGYESVVHDPDNGWDDIKLNSYVLDQDFGFGLYRTTDMRFWIGPELRISYSQGSPEDDDDLEFKLWGFGVGPVAGINFHMSRKVSLCLKAGLLAISYAGELEDDRDRINDETYVMSQGYAFFNFSLLFRFGEPTFAIPQDQGDSISF
jgi:hypothetical protein